MKPASKRALLIGRIVAAIIVVAMAFLAGYAVRKFLAPASPAAAQAAGADQKDQKWTCSMHPEIVADAPGKCPKCGMDLIPMSAMDDAGTDSTRITVSETAARLMEVQTTPVQRKHVTNEIRMVGKIDYDETLVEYITSWVPGRIDELYVDYTGITVNEGDHMVYLYSPQLLSTQAELLQAVKAVDKMDPQSSDLVKRSIRATLEAAREKMRLLGLTEKQINDIEESGELVDHLTIYAPSGGIVIEKNASEGMYVDTGTRLFTIADLSRLWVKLDAYESDMMWIRYGQKVEFTTEAYPGEAFEGTISFIDPVLNDKTRTVKLRANVSNPDGRLKPDMFVRAVVRSKMASKGRVMAPSLRGKYICPMHPDVVKDSPGDCDICNMDLVTAESMGYNIVEANEPPLVIPASAPLVTGKRAFVYIRVPAEKPTFEGRRITLGPRAGDYYIVKEGLEEGEIVVTNGNFKIDSELQLRAKPSMMSAEQPPQRHAAPHEQKICPVMGFEIDKSVFTEYKGKKVYFCCPSCIEEFEKDPEKYLDKLPQFQTQSDSHSHDLNEAITEH